MLSSLAFSGSTLFGLALGRHSRMTTLGEVMYLERDYHPNLQCSCGERLGECPMWSRVVKQANSQSVDVQFKFDKKWKGVDFDKKGFNFYKFLLINGFRPQRIYRDDQIENYRIRNGNFFNLMGKEFPDTEYFVDLSKTPERMEVLMGSPSIDAYYIHLRRNLKAVYKSNLSRRKMTRKGWGFKMLRESYLLHARERHRRKVFDRVPKSKRITVDFDLFKAQPMQEYRHVLNWLNLQDEEIKDPRSLSIKKQHLYLGNRWLFSSDPNYDVQISESSQKVELNRLERMSFNIFKTLLNPNFKD
ncbi:hypothetical protein BST85_04465 [Aureitalea marina]|uniref:Sulfotransferase domain-containing protein n=2 Tax=Aureitalea marina TaxID=930804 RepID=A0A2S7KNN2_9FLAO|nr:hypothetical protein BST85_04465 [Aureitalea marina]